LGKLRRVKRWEGGEGKEKGQGIKGGKKRMGRKVLPKKKHLPLHHCFHRNE